MNQHQPQYYCNPVVLLYKPSLPTGDIVCTCSDIVHNESEPIRSVLYPVVLSSRDWSPSRSIIVSSECYFINPLYDSSIAGASGIIA